MKPGMFTSAWSLARWMVTAFLIVGAFYAGVAYWLTR